MVNFDIQITVRSYQLRCRIRFVENAIQNFLCFESTCKCFSSETNFANAQLSRPFSRRMTSIDWLLAPFESSIMKRANTASAANLILSRWASQGALIRRNRIEPLTEKVAVGCQRRKKVFALISANEARSSLNRFALRISIRSANFCHQLRLLISFATRSLAKFMQSCDCYHINVKHHSTPCRLLTTSASLCLSRSAPSGVKVIVICQ
jgi:type III secretory pathway component EscU